MKTLMKQSRGWLVMALVSALSSATAWASIEEPPGFKGQWEGWIVIVPATVELELMLDLSRTDEGAWSGEIIIPSVGLEKHRVEELLVDGSQISFRHEVEGVRRGFWGRISEDGRQIEGIFGEQDRNRPFKLERSDENTFHERLSRELQVVTDDGEQLRQVFNKDQGSVRLLLLLSPTCGLCKVSAQVVQKYVLEKIKDEKLRIYVVWMPIRNDDSKEKAMSSAGNMYGSRVRNFWMEEAELAEGFKEPLGLVEHLAWDVVLAFSAESHWDDGLPRPSFFMHQRKGEFPSGRRLNGLVLADEVGRLLQQEAATGQVGR